jgi:aldose 1-epimerase
LQLALLSGRIARHTIVRIRARVVVDVVAETMNARIGSRNDEGFEAIELVSPDARLSATFVPSLNMICSSLVHDGADLLYRRGGLVAYAQNAKTCCIPLLHPWANRLASDDYVAAGRRVELAPHTPGLGRDAGGLPNHGLLGGRTAWEVIDRSCDESGAAIGARFVFDDPQLLASFPFPHEIGLRAVLTNEALEITTTILPSAGVTLPVSFGWHPYFRCPGSARETWMLTVPVRKHVVLDARMIPTGAVEDVSIAPAPLAERTFDDLFTEIEAPRRFVLEDISRRIEVEFGAAYPFAQMWAPEASPFVCIEPMTAAINALADPRFAPPTVTAPATFEATFTVRVTSTR